MVRSCVLCPSFQSVAFAFSLKNSTRVVDPSILFLLHSHDITPCHQRRAKTAKQEQLAKKREAQRALEEEEKTLKSKPSKAVTGEEKKAIKKTQKVEAFSEEVKPVEEFSASNIDDALDLLSLTGSSGGSGSTNVTTGKGKDIDRHPERRFKAAFAAYLEREMPIYKKENPGLRQNQMQDALYKLFQKSPENPFNQANVIAYDATRGEERDHVESRKQGIAERLRND
ncbi:hypothetical protein B0O80DRAFT_209471 [Mortierella sp. GBAus27b]|nr:hypothetical protein B0O80DRAFT_209471 [Mortierella sp. GBAus27b]